MSDTVVIFLIGVPTAFFVVALFNLLEDAIVPIIALIGLALLSYALGSCALKVIR